MGVDGTASEGKIAMLLCFSCNNPIQFLVQLFI